MNRKTIYTAFVLGMVQLLSAQTDLGTETINVVRDYDPTLSEVRKFVLFPEIEDSTTQQPKLNYSLLKMPYKVRFEPASIPSARISGTKVEEIKRGFARLGMGNYTTPLAELYFTNRRSRNQSSGIWLRHMSSAGGINNYAYNGYGMNDIQLWGKRFYEGFTLSGEFHYDHDRVHYYGFLDPETLKDTIRQDYQSISAKVGLMSSKGRSKSIFHNADVAYYHFFDRFGTTENYVDFDGGINFKVEEELVTVDLELDYINTNFGDSTQNYFVTGVSPTIHSTWEDLDFEIGASIYVRTDVSAGENKLYLLPQIKASYALVREILIAYGGFTSAYNQNTYRSITRDNPFVFSEVELKPTVEKYRFYLGLKGALSSKASFNVFGRFSGFENFALFYTDSTYFLRPDSNKFTVLYDNITQFQLGGELLYQSSERFDIGAKAEYNYYGTTLLEYAYHLPNLRMSIFTGYNISDKLIVNAEAFVVGKRDILPVNYSDRELAPYYDINLGVEYRYSELLSAFIQINNLTAKKYDLWYGYAAQRFNVLGGVTYRF